MDTMLVSFLRPPGWFHGQYSLFHLSLVSTTNYPFLPCLLRSSRPNAVGGGRIWILPTVLSFLIWLLNLICLHFCLWCVLPVWSLLHVASHRRTSLGRS
jgi:uncharacterized membrane protein YbhN (UPF0104 family)